MVLRDRYLPGNSIGGTSGGEDDRNSGRGSNQSLKEAKRIAQIISVVLGGIADGLAHIGIGREMEYGLHGSTLQAALCQGGMSAAEYRIEQAPIAHLAFHKRNTENIMDEVGMAVDEIVEHGNLVACPRKSPYGMTTDVASPSGHQNPHFSTLTSERGPT
jgi:hypothetical protein